MRLFISAGEPSGDIHGANLIRELRNRRPNIDIVGFGGERMQAAGAKLIYPLANLAVMGIINVLRHIATFWRLYREAGRLFREEPPDALILIDYPGFHWWLARAAKRNGVPVFYFVAPQLWAWAGWRVRKMRRLVDHVLCTLPFEEQWYRERGVNARYIGHPFFDELPRQQLDPAFLADQRSRSGPIVALLPGSRTMEVERNIETLLQVAAAVVSRQPDARFLVAAFKEKHREMIETHLASRTKLPIETCVGRTPEIIELCQACVSVSGSVALEMLYRRKPTIIVYRVTRGVLTLARFFITTRFICLVNLLAGKIVYPEFLTHRDESAAIADQLTEWISNPAAREAVVGELTALCHTSASPGACGRAADAILNELRAADRVAA